MNISWHFLLLLIGVILLVISAWPAANTRVNVLALGLAFAFASFLFA